MPKRKQNKQDQDCQASHCSGGSQPEGEPGYPSPALPQRTCAWPGGSLSRACRPSSDAPPDLSGYYAYL